MWFYPGPDCAQCKDVPSVVEAAAQKLTSWGVLVAAVDTEKDAKLAKELGMNRDSSSALKVGGTWGVVVVVVVVYSRWYFTYRGC